MGLVFRLEGRSGWWGGCRPFSEREFEQPAGDRAVHQGDAVHGAKAEVRRRGRVGGEDCGPPTAAPGHQPVAQAAKQRAGTGQRQTFAVRRIRQHQAGSGRGPHLLEMPLFDRDRPGHARRCRAGLRRLHRPRIEVARGTLASRLTDPCLQVGHEPFDEGLVAVAKPKEAVRRAAGPPETRRHARRDRRSLDHERARAAHRIENRLARGGVARRARPPPARDREHPGGEHLREWRLDLPHPPAPLVERAAGGVAEDRCHVADEVQRQPQRRPAELHARPPAARRPQLVHHGVLDDLRRVERVGEKRVVDRGIDPKGVRDPQLLRPVDLLHRPIQGLRRIDPKPPQRLEHPDRHAALEHRPIERLSLAARLRRKLDRPPADPQVAGPDGLELAGQHPLEPLERPRSEPSRLIGLGCGQRTRTRGNVRENGGAHAWRRLYPRRPAGTMKARRLRSFRLPRRRVAR